MEGAGVKSTFVALPSTSSRPYLRLCHLCHLCRPPWSHPSVAPHDMVVVHYHYRYCSMGKTLSQLPLTNDIGYKPATRKVQQRRKDCKLDATKCKCSNPDCSDKLGCNECEKNTLGDKVCPKRVPGARFVGGLSPIPECSWSNKGNFFDFAYAIPLWTANVFPSLTTELMTLWDELETCTAGKPPAYKAPVPGKIAKGKKCKEGADETCATMWCESSIIPFKSPSCANFKPAGNSLADGKPCKFSNQCLSGNCISKTFADGKCGKTVVTGNTCKTAIDKLWALFQKPALVASMTDEFNAAFGVMTAADAKLVCPGYSPGYSEMNDAGELTVVKAVGTACSAKQAFSLVFGKVPAKKTGAIFGLMAEYAKKLDGWAAAAETTMAASLQNTLPADKYTVDWDASLDIGTTFGWGDAAGSVGFW